MMGHSHAVSGAMVYAATVPFLPPLLLHTHLRPADVLLGTVLAAGAALLPDLDHHDGTIANFLGPFSKLLCRFVAKISGGHRHATHSLLFVALMGGGTWAGVHYLGRWFTLGLTFFLLALAIKALRLHVPGDRHHTWLTVIGLAVVGTVVMDKWMPSAPVWLPYAVALGTLTHLMGDCLTKMGAPLLWPHKERYEIVLIKRSGNDMETKVLVPIMTVATFAALWFTALEPTVLN
ncbi:metal-dependent hydrolase [Kitasatospora viridis]|uniref:LexA-binding, inner membrane-associated putative hydrolase n=1 Tax=Kitasatospora viridis TaxID=281105 RepID=A0A561UIF2_9ACTN|nr:metal-dependent hydrolase [Kitasatospora viridis]TWF99135.1 LexA-binding, inner membrane-associated putative hydrolase [Kitasatospora viridis]